MLKITNSYECSKLSKDKRKISGNNSKVIDKRESKDKPNSFSIKKNKLEETIVNNLISSQKNEKDMVEYTNDPKNFKNLTMKRTKKEDQVEFGVQANEYDIYEDTKTQINKTDLILKEIIDIKEAKENTKQLPKADTVGKLQKRLNTRLEQNLIKLLLIILDKNQNEIDDIKDKPEIVRDQIKLLLKNIEKLKGQVIDGHPKPKLLYKFLKEYKKLTEEVETNSKLSNQSYF